VILEKDIASESKCSLVRLGITKELAHTLFLLLFMCLFTYFSILVLLDYSAVFITF
jgi:hypothetical protein